MKNKTRLSSALVEEASLAGLTQAQLAKLADMTQGAISQLIAKGFRAAPATLERLTHCWPDKRAGVSLLAAHLYDEIIRAGHAPENFEITLKGERVEAKPSSFEKDLAYLRDVSERVPVVRDLLHNIATLTREELDKQRKPLNLAAEKHARYGSNKETK